MGDGAPPVRARSFLNELNRRFYQRHAAAFARTRSGPWPGWSRLVAALPDGPGVASAPLHVLDLGCGNARLFPYLSARLGRPLRYLGVDSGPAMLGAALACRPPRGERHTLTLCAFDLELGWPFAPTARFDLVLLFGVLHHLPGASLRREAVRRAAHRVREGGMLAITFWQFAEHPSLLARTLPWPDHAPNVVREPGDHLLGFGDDPHAVRYCHSFDAEQAAALAAASGLEVADTFEADGRSGRLNRYYLLRRLKPRG